MYEFIDKGTGNVGTLLNRKAFMAIQGFLGQTTLFKDDGSIVEINSDGHKKTTTFNEDGSITETFVGVKTISKRTLFEDGRIIEVIT